MNGREWLARQMDSAGLQYVRQDNCFPWLEDWPRAQQLMDQQLQMDWPGLLDGIAQRLNPLHQQLFHAFATSYYWTVYQSEWAIDFGFRQASELSRLVPRLVQHALTSFGSPNVVRFLGRRVPLSGALPTSFDGQVFSLLQRGHDGVRIKHRAKSNWLKLYDKAFTPIGSVLRAEATLNTVQEFRVFRAKQGDAHGELAQRPLRRGVADLPRRAEVGRKAAERYVDALASVEPDWTLDELVRRLSQPRHWHGRRVRPLRPFAPDDGQLLQAVSDGQFILNGVRNRDLQRVFFPHPAATPLEARRRSAWVSRKLRLLRAHGLIRKIPHTHRYQLTPAGRTTTTAILTARQATLRQLALAAA